MIVSNPKKPLNKAVEMSKFELFCIRIAPYLIILFSVLLTILIFIALVKYGGILFGTEANQMEHLERIL